jgi:hypothetical protein
MSEPKAHYPKYRNEFEERLGDHVSWLVGWAWPNLNQSQRDSIAKLGNND